MVDFKIGKRHKSTLEGQNSRCDKLTIKLHDGSFYDIPTELISEGSISDNAADLSTDSIPLFPAAFAWWWIVIDVLDLIAIGLGAWVFGLKRK